MLYVFRITLITVLLAAAAVFPVSAQDRNSITGFIFGPDRMPVGNMYVELQSDFYSTIARTQTNGSGMYSFRGLPNGNYVVKVLPQGTHFQEQSRSISLIPISPIGRGAVSEQVDFYLQVRKTTERLSAPEVLFVQEVPQKAKELYQAGVEHLDKKNETEGYEKIKLALETFPDYFVALDRLGNEYLAKGYYEASFVLFTRAVAVNPRSISSNLGLGISEFRLNRVKRSIELFEAVLRLHKENINAHYWMGVALHATGNYSGALGSLQRAEKLSDGKSPEVQWQLARVYKDQNKFKESADALEQYLKLRPDAQNADEIRRIIRSLRDKQTG